MRGAGFGGALTFPGRCTIALNVIGGCGGKVSALKRTCVYMDFRFAQLKALDQKLICLVFIEAVQVYGGELRGVLKPILVHADGFAVSEEELGTELRRLLSSSYGSSTKM